MNIYQSLEIYGNYIDKFWKLCNTYINIQHLRKGRVDMGLMNLLLHCSLAVCLAGAGLWDLRTRRVPNTWFAVWFVSGFGVMVSSGWLTAAGYLVRSAATVGGLFLFFLCRMMGAADIKCMALICAYLGFASGGMIIGSGMVFGACWSLGKLLYRKRLRERFGCLTAWFGRVVQEKRVIAYYVPKRDKKGATVPLVFCLFVGYCWVWLLEGGM